MSIRKELLDILCCPVSKTPLILLNTRQLEQLNQAIIAGEIQNIMHQPVTKPLMDGLITTDHKVIYPIEDDIPILLPEAGIGTTQLKEKI